MAIDPACREGLYMLLSELPLYQGGRKPSAGWQARESPHDGPRCPSDRPSSFRLPTVARWAGVRMPCLCRRNQMLRSELHLDCKPRS